VVLTTDFSSKSLKWLNALAFISVIIVNALAGGTTLIGGQTTAAVSDKYSTLITPAGYVFSIWGVIYLLLALFIIFQALPGEKNRELREKIGFLFIISCLLNIVWIVLWQYEYLIFSVIIIFLLLLSLIMIYLRLEIGKSRASLREKIAFRLPFSVYLGWITIASIANVATALVSAGWDGFGMSPESWALIIVAVALLITILVLWTRRDIAYGLVVIWAFAGIAVKQSANQTVAIATEMGAIIVAIILIAVIFYSILRPKKMT